MSRLALYQKYRSQTFGEVVGQEHVVRAIQNAVREDQVGHAYLFCGPRGTGKTTMARLLARAVNCENKSEAPCGHCLSCQEALEGNHPDIIEINAANETHVEDIRALIERAQLAPMMGKFKIYIVDEVHQLSTSASSALLKTLEEPPAHVIFILATTDPQKLLNTIISRCQRFDFTKVDAIQIQRHLMSIAAQEDFTLNPKAAMKIAELADGGMRDSLSILEQASSYALGDITEEIINDIFGLASIPEKMELLNDIFEGNLEGVIKRIRDAQNHGIDLKHLTNDLGDMLKDGVIYHYTKSESLLKKLNEMQALEIANRAKPSILLEMVKMLNQASLDYRFTSSIADYFEVTCMQLIALVKEGTLSPMRDNETQRVEEVKPVVHVEAPKPVTPPVVKPTVPVAPAPKVEVKEEVVSRETITPTVQPTSMVNEELPMEQVLGLLAQCDKQHKGTSMERMNALLNTATPNRYIATLRQCQIGASGQDCIVFIARTNAIRNTINAQPFNQELYYYLSENGMDQVPFAVTNDYYQHACQEFVKGMKANNLPTYHVERYAKVVQEKELQPIDKVMQTFGEGLVEVFDE